GCIPIPGPDLPRTYHRIPGRWNPLDPDWWVARHYYCVNCLVYRTGWCPGFYQVCIRLANIPEELDLTIKECEKRHKRKEGELQAGVRPLSSYVASSHKNYRTQSSVRNT